MARWARSQGASPAFHVQWWKCERNLAVRLLLFAAVLLPKHTQGVRIERRATGAASATEDDKCAWPGSALLQGQSRLSEQALRLSRSGELSNDAQDLRAKRDSCAELQNRGSHFTINVKVGTPPQDFDLVTDTGSNALIVTSCVCQTNGGGCTADQGDCFTGTKKSSTFNLPKQSWGGPAAVELSFGSGKIQAVIATDDVKVGDRTTRMKDSLLLMVERELELSGPFEGILGLGLPTNFSSQADSSDSSDEGGMQMKGGSKGPGMQVYGFMELSNTSAFTVCFNDGANGVLRMDPPPPPVWLGTVGKAHWSLEMQGITVGKGTTLEAKVDICSEKLPGQKTACGAVPDSGTTVIMGPANQMKLLFEAICKAWPRCDTQAQQSGTEPSQALQALLIECEDWLGANGSVGSNAGAALNEELPSLTFKLADESGKQATVELDPVDYIMETMSSDLTFTAEHLMGIFPAKLLKHALLADKKVCIPAFGEMEFNTKDNGPVWILGTPIFYKYQVGYNMSSSPPGIAFIEESCGTCQEASFVSHRSGARLEKTARAMHRVRGPLRVPNIDKSKGL